MCINGIIDAIPAVSNIPDNSKIKNMEYIDFISLGSRIFFNLDMGLLEKIFIIKILKECIRFNDIN
tara:strand:+ start:299 stop:496 length:198 start_codon:yes stop_codon:yes gene_type:complete